MANKYDHVRIKEKMVEGLTDMFASRSWWFGDQDNDDLHDNDQSQKQLSCTATLYDHQNRAVEWLTNIDKGGMLCLTMGLGKSLTVSYWSLMVEKAEQILLVVSKSLVPNWISMLDQFFPGLSYDVLHADIGKDPRKYNNEENSRFIITTYDVVISMASLHSIRTLVYRRSQSMVTRTEDTLLCEGKGSWLFKTKFDVVIADESQIFRNLCGQLYPSMMGLTSNKYICLTGTPIQNTFEDLYTQMRWMAVPNVNHFDDFDQTKFEELELGKHVLMMGYEDAGIKLPECIEHEIELVFTKNESKAYELLRFEALEQLNGKKESKTKTRKKDVHILALIIQMRFACMCIGLAYRKQNVLTVPGDLRKMLRNPMSEYWCNSTKFKAVRQLISDIIERKEKVIVFSTFQVSLREFGEGLKKVMGIHPISVTGSMDIEHRQAMIKTFKTSVVHPVMLLTFQIGAEGMNLTEANNIVFLDSWWSPSVSRQAIARSWRIGQTSVVNVYKFRMANSIEDRVYEIVRNKSEIVEQFETGVISSDTFKAIV